MMKNVLRKILPEAVKRNLWLARDAVNITAEWKKNLHLARLRIRMSRRASHANMTERLLDYNVHINDGQTYYALYKDIFINKIYHFYSQRQDPLILDCGSNMGGMILYLKHVYPQARIIGFEADPVIFPYLQKNINDNGLTDVRLIHAALAKSESILTFYSDGKCGSCLAEYLPKDIQNEWTKHEVPAIRLRDYLTEPVDFLKMNIEGAEWEVLADCGDRLRQVREMVIEYHHWPGLPRTLHHILEMLNRLGFEYLINDFDSEANGNVYPPFSLTKESRYYLLIYAKKMD